MMRKVLTVLGAVAALGLASSGSAAAPRPAPDRCSAAAALVTHLATGSAKALGAPAHNLRSAPEQAIFAKWPGGPPPREILVGLNEEHPASVLDCAGVTRLARKTGMAIVRDAPGAAGAAAVDTAYASLPALSADGNSAASVVSTLKGGHGITQVITLTRQGGKWQVAGAFIVSFS